MFADRLPLAVQYAALLAGPGTERGLLGPREVPRLWDRHLLNCAVLTDLIPERARVVDVGSGAGLPGLALAIRRPDLQVTLLEPLLRRTRFLQEVVETLGLEAVEVLRGRAEELHGQRSFEVVCSRAVAPLDRLLPWCMPLAERGGLVLAMKGKTAQQELDAASGTVQALGGRTPVVVHIGSNLLTFPTTAVRVEAGVDAPIRSGSGRGSAGSTRHSASRTRRSRR